jgi:hypothetical protein
MNIKPRSNHPYDSYAVRKYHLLHGPNVWFDAPSKDRPMQNSLAFATAPHSVRHAGTLACDARRRAMASADLSGVLLSHRRGALHRHAVKRVAEIAEPPPMPVLPMFLQRCRRLSEPSGNQRNAPLETLVTLPPVTRVSVTNISRAPPPAPSGLERAQHDARRAAVRCAVSAMGYAPVQPGKVTGGRGANLVLYRRATLGTVPAVTRISSSSHGTTSSRGSERISATSKSTRSRMTASACRLSISSWSARNCNRRHTTKNTASAQRFRARQLIRPSMRSVAIFGIWSSNHMGHHSTIEDHRFIASHARRGGFRGEATPMSNGPSHRLCSI